MAYYKLNGVPAEEDVIESSRSVEGCSQREKTKAKARANKICQEMNSSVVSHLPNEALSLSKE